MNLPTEIFGRVAVVHSPEELGGDYSESFTEFATELPQHQIVLDLDSTELLDSNGLAAMLDVQDALVSQGGNLKVAVSNVNNRKILEITRMDRRIEVFDNVLDAVKSFR